MKEVIGQDSFFLPVNTFAYHWHIQTLPVRKIYCFHAEYRSEIAYTLGRMVYIVLPVFNEEKTIEWTIREIRKVLAGIPFRIVVVNDGSRDGTAGILKDCAGKDLMVLSYRINMNIGAVFATGIDEVMRLAKDSDTLVIMESDRTSSPNLIPRLVGTVENGKYDICIASRYVPGGAYRNFPLSRRIFSQLASHLMRSVFPIRGVRDYTIFFRAYRIGILREAIDHFGRFGLIQSKGFVANAELLVKLSFFTNRITEIPFVYDYGVKKGRSKLGIIRTVNEYFVALGYLTGIRRKLDILGQSMHQTMK